tara:strand:- start:3338 stop:4075 length:738 start_codon:yes stop_codon:yes gene_type:complete
MRLIFNIIVVLFISSLNSLADTYEERRFIIEAKFRILPSIKVMEIYTKLEIKEDNYDYIFDIKSKNIVKFINEINGTGKVKGKILNNQYIPSNYTYSYKRKEKNKYVEIVYKKNDISEITIIPNYDKSKLTPLTGRMLEATIDPSTFFLSILDYKNINNCQKTFRIFDGKRRYDVQFNKLRTSSNNLIECEAKQIKLGGYKDKENDVFAASDFIKIVYDNRNNEFLRYEARNGSIDIIIVETELK